MALKSLEIQEKIDKLVDESTAINNIAKEEGRDFNEDEQTRWDAINDEKTGELPVLLAKKKLAEKREAEQERLATLRSGAEASVPKVSAAIAPQPQEQRRMFAVPAGPKPKGFQSREAAYRSGNWMAAALFGNKTAEQRLHDWGMPIRAEMIEGNNLTGGYVVPAELEQSIIDLREEYGVFRRYVTPRPMASDVVTIPRRKSGLTAYCVGESADITESDMGFSAVEVTAKKWGVLTKLSTELNEDSFVSMAGLLAEEGAYALETKLDQCGFIGDGSNTYGGITGAAVRIRDGNHAASLLSATGGDDEFDELIIGDLQTLVGMLPQFPGIRPVWHITKPGYYASMVRLEMAAGGSTMRHYEEGPMPTFMGYPVQFNNVMLSDVTTAAAGNDVTMMLFGDLGMSCTLGERRGLTAAVSTDRYFEEDMIGVKLTARWGISCHDLGDGTNAGPIVGLEGTT